MIWYNFFQGNIHPKGDWHQRSEGWHDGRTEDSPWYTYTCTFICIHWCMYIDFEYIYIYDINVHIYLWHIYTHMYNKYIYMCHIGPLVELHQMDLSTGSKEELSEAIARYVHTYIYIEIMSMFGSTKCMYVVRSTYVPIWSTYNCTNTNTSMFIDFNCLKP
jgi:hypothetical protein